MLIDPLRANKFEPKYIGPYTVVRRAHNGAYVLKDMTGDVLDRHVPADQLKLISKQRRRRDENEPMWEVKEILNHRGTPGAYEYYVDWKDYGEEARSWEPQSGFQDTKVIQEYWRKFQEKTKQSQH
jgi:hypothetical protein